MSGSLSDEDFAYIYARVPRLCVDVVILRPTTEKVLLVKRGIVPFKGYWCNIGGSVNIDESPQQAAARHARTDLGVEINILGVVGVFQYLDTSGKYPPNNVIVAYAATIARYQPVALSAEAQDFAWFPYQRLPAKMSEFWQGEVESAVSLFS